MKFDVSLCWNYYPSPFSKKIAKKFATDRYTRVAGSANILLRDDVIALSTTTTTTVTTTLKVPYHETTFQSKTNSIQYCFHCLS
jgi:hypothetical protein